MTGAELLQRLVRNVPGAPMSGFVAELNEEVRRLWRARAWQWWQVEVAMSTSHSFAALAITNGVDSATVVDGDAQGVFDALHVGRTFTIEGVGYTVASVTDSNTLVLSGLYDFDGGSNPESGTLPRVAFALPTTAGLVFSRMIRVFLSGDEDLVQLYDPRHYTLGLAVGGVSRMELRVALYGSTDYVVRYLRRPVEVVGLDAEIDVSEDLVDPLYHGLEGRYLRRTEPKSETEMVSWQRRVSESQTLLEETLKAAKASETMRRVERRQNAKTVF